MIFFLKPEHYLPILLLYRDKYCLLWYGLLLCSNWMLSQFFLCFCYSQERLKVLASALPLSILALPSSVSLSLMIAAREDKSYLVPVKAGASTSIYKVHSNQQRWRNIHLAANYKEVLWCFSEIDGECARQRRKTRGDWAPDAGVGRSEGSGKPRRPRWWAPSATQVLGQEEEEREKRVAWIFLFLCTTEGKKYFI